MALNLRPSRTLPCFGYSGPAMKVRRRAAVRDAKHGKRQKSPDAKIAIAGLHSSGCRGKGTPCTCRGAESFNPANQMDRPALSLISGSRVRALHVCAASAVRRVFLNCFPPCPFYATARWQFCPQISDSPNWRREPCAALQKASWSMPAPSQRLRRYVPLRRCGPASRGHSDHHGGANRIRKMSLPKCARVRCKERATVS